MIDRRISAVWPHADDMDVLGLGQSEIYLQRLTPHARRVVSAAPAAQGVAPWPSEGANATVLVDEERLPFPDAMFDRTLIVHALEEADSPTRMLRELWRVTAPEGRILVVVANRSGLWARAESTPFGHGPPANLAFITKAAETWERTGEKGWPGFGGVMMVEAVKRLYIDPKAEAKRVDPARAKSVMATQGAAAPQSRSQRTANRLEKARERELEPSD